MDSLTFIAELVKALAWPASVLIFLIVFRHSLANLIPRLLKLKYKEFEADFSESLKRIETQVEQAALPSVVEAEKMTVGFPELAGNKYRRLAEISPRTTILEAWRDVEQAVLKVSGPEDFWDVQEDEYPDPSLTIDRLKRERKLDPISAHIFEELNELRNRTLHAYDTDVSTADAVEFALLASRLSKKIKTLSN